jgi:hypothetical protein
VVGHTHPEVQYLPPRIRLQLSSSGSTVATISHVAYNVISIGTTLLTAIAQLRAKHVHCGDAFSS